MEFWFDFRSVCELLPYVGYRPFSALLKHKSGGSLCCICTCGWCWPEPYGDQIWGLLSISGLTAPLLSRYSRSYFGSVYAVYTMMPLFAGSKCICVCAGTDNAIQFTSSLAAVCFQTGSSPSDWAIKFQKVIFFPPAISSLFKNMQQSFIFRCPICYSSLTTGSQREQVVLRVPALDAKGSTTGAWKCTVIGNSSNHPLLGSWDTLEQTRPYAWSLTPLLNPATCRKNIFIYV